MSPEETTPEQVRAAHPRWTIEQDQQTGEWWAYPRWTSCRSPEHRRHGRSPDELAIKLRMTENAMGLLGRGLGLTDGGHA